MLRSFFEVFVVVYQPCLYHTRSCIEILPRKCGESVTNSSQRLCYTMNTHPVADRTAPHLLDSMIYYLTNGGQFTAAGDFVSVLAIAVDPRRFKAPPALPDGKAPHQAYPSRGQSADGSDCRPAPGRNSSRVIQCIRYTEYTLNRQV